MSLGEAQYDPALIHKRGHGMVSYGDSSRLPVRFFYMDTGKNGNVNKQLMIEIMMDEKSVHVTPVEEKHKRIWRASYERFMQSESNEGVTGTPLTDWPIVSDAQRRELASYGTIGVKSVEQLAELSDTHFQELGNGYRALRDKAAAWLEEREKGQGISNLVEQNTNLELQVEALQQQIAELAAKQEEKDKPKASKAKSRSKAK